MSAPDLASGAASNDARAFRTLPHNLAAEKGLLGSLMVENRGYETVGEFLRPPHFALLAHGEIFAACGAIITRGGTADPISLENVLKESEALAEMGGPGYLSELAHSGVGATTGAEYARIVYDCHQRRELIRLGENMVAEAYQGDATETAREVLERHEQALFESAETEHVGPGGPGARAFSHFAGEALAGAEAARAGGSPGVMMGFADLDRRVGGLHRSDLVILAGRPSMGKTALATNIARNVATGGVGVGFFSLEMSGAQVAGRELAGRCGLSPHRLRTGNLDSTAVDMLRTAAENTRDLPLFIDDTPALTVAALRARARRLKRRHDIGLVVVDYLQLMEGPGESKTVETSNISRGLKAIAKEIGLPVLALSQLSRAVESRPDKRPQLSDLRESGAIEQDADVVMFIFRAAYYMGAQAPERREGETETAFANRLLKWEQAQGVAEVIIAKHRHGPVGNERLRFDATTVRFENLQRGPA